jgi:hypothetical protein
VTLALLVLAGGLVIIGVLVLARWFTAKSWRRGLVGFRLLLPANLTADDVARWLGSVAATTHPPQWSLLPLPPVCIHVVADPEGIRHYLLVAESMRDRLLAGLRASLPGVRVESAADFVDDRPRYRLAAEAAMTSRSRPLAFERTEAVSALLLSSLHPVPAGSEIHIQFVVTSAGTSAPVKSAGRDDSPVLPWWLERDAPVDADAVRAERVKQRDQLLIGTLRVGVVCVQRPQAYRLLGQVWGNWHGLNAPGVRVVRRWLPSFVVSGRMASRSYPLLHWPLLINSREATAMVAFPLAGVALPGLALGAARQLPPSPSMPTRGAVLGASNYVGSEGQPLALGDTDRLRHLFCLGPTGSGKSWLLAQLILQDIAAGHGVICVDVKGDLVTDVLDRVSDKDAERVIVLDASKRELPIGFNVLGSARTEEARELVVDNVLHIFKETWAAYWGPRSDSIMRAALTTLVHTKPADSSAHTLCEILPLLNQPPFRRLTLADASLPDSLRSFWQWYESLSDGEMRQMIAPVANKIEAFTSRTPIRLMLGQADGLNLTSIFTDRRVLLVNLAKGSLGSETSALLGSLLVSKLWMATLARIAVPGEQRRPVFAYLDEMQDIVRLPLSMSEILSQARGLGLGVTLATQFAAQLPESLRAAVLGTVGSLTTFAVDHDDARLLAKRFAPLTVEDLQGLGRYEIALRPTVNGQRLAPVTGSTMPLTPVTRDGAELANASRQRYGTPRAEVERALRQRTAVTAPGLAFGREAGGAS